MDIEIIISIVGATVPFVAAIIRLNSRIKALEVEAQSYKARLAKSEKQDEKHEDLLSGMKQDVFAVSNRVTYLEAKSDIKPPH